MSVVEKHRRIQESLLSRPERQVLRWLAARMPGWVTPDQLTAFGTVGAALVLLGYGLSTLRPAFLWLAVAGFVINWFGDSLDGTLARYRKQERPRYGFFVDHTVDTINEIMMILAFGFSPYAHFSIAACTLISYFALAQLSYINTIVSGEFRISGAKFGPTEARVIGIAATIALLFWGGPLFTLPLLGPSTWLDGLLVAMSIFFLGLFAGVAGKLGAGLAKLEP